MNVFIARFILLMARTSGLILVIFITLARHKPVLISIGSRDRPPAMFGRRLRLPDFEYYNDVYSVLRRSYVKSNASIKSK